MNEVVEKDGRYYKVVNVSGHYQGLVEIPTAIEKLKMDVIHKQLIELNEEKEELETKLNGINEWIKGIKESLLQHAESGNQQPWTWIFESGRASVKWKEEFIKIKGAKAAENIANASKANFKPIKNIGIRFIDPTPDTIVQIKENPDRFPAKKVKLNKK